MAARHLNSTFLSRFMDHIVDNVHYYSRHRDKMLMGKYKIRNQRHKSFNHLVQYIIKKVNDTRMWLKQQTGKERTPFITVGHDGWDSKDYDMLGVCIHFVDILNEKKCTVAVGLQHLVSKKSDHIAAHVLKILERYVFPCMFLIKFSMFSHMHYCH